MGAFGKNSMSDFDVWECVTCGARYLPPLIEDTGAYYQSGEYRDDLSQGNAVGDYFRLTDDEQPHKLNLVGMHQLRAEIVADIGCGAGPFLDLVKGIASRTIAVEPNECYHESLRQRGHDVYTWAHDVPSSLAGHIYAAVSYSVIEHVDNPLTFLRDIRRLLKPGGVLVLSTPNADDWMVANSTDYAAFFYRKFHLWYFTAAALKRLAALAGFVSCEVTFDHRFDLSNAMVWMRDKCPSGNGKLTFDAALNANWRECLIREGRSDYIYAILRAAP
jgi:2-polyprenyl-3-methyl-5-hydroxy-6-metoxy-1,4-benzoquinol methylase